MRCGVIAFVMAMYLCSTSVVVAQPMPMVMPTDSAVMDVADVFAQGCLHNKGIPANVRAWAQDAKLPAVTNSLGRKIFTGDEVNGEAWFIKKPATGVVIAIRIVGGACAVFGEHADAADSARMYEIYLRALSGGQESRVTRRPDRVQPDKFGTRTGKFASIVYPNGNVTVLTMFANEKPGGGYQVSLQMSSTGR